jgi:Flp pilus assembly protein TadG
VIDRRGEEGAVAIIVALLLVVLMAAVALTVDVGGLYLRRRALVNGADAGALAAARTCARGVGHDPRFASAEEAADFEVQANAPITTDEVAPTNLTFPPPGGCAAPSQYGHTTVQYTSEQALYFAPVLGFGHTSPVTTTATASWGLGSNNPVPIVLTNLLAPGTCQMPPSGTIAKGQTCTFWYDNDTLNGGNFAFLSLNAAGWDVPVNSNCSGSSSGGTSTLTDWINGTLPASVVLNWRFPTYVCTDTGIRGVGGKGGPHSQVWSALNDLIGQTRDFPINWEGCGTAPFTACPPVPGAPAQGTIYKQGNIDKYDIIGFGAMTILHVYGATDPQVQGTPAQDYTCTGKVKNNMTILPGVYSWSGLAAFLVGGPCQLPPSLPADSVNSVTLQGLNTPADYTYDTNGVTLTTALTEQKNVDFSLHMNAQPGVCGDITLHDRSAVCVITSWQGSTLDADFPPGTDNNTIIRLCDLAYAGSCLDQHPR